MHAHRRRKSNARLSTDLAVQRTLLMDIERRGARYRFTLLMDRIFLPRRCEWLLHECPEIKFVVLLRPSRLLVARCVCYPQLSHAWREQHVVQIRFHRDRSIHQTNGLLDGELLVLTQNSLRNAAQILVAIA